MNRVTGKSGRSEAILRASKYSVYLFLDPVQNELRIEFIERV